MQEVMLSVIIPIYNAEKYLKQCLDSIINQTYQNIEIICVNDCSTDNSLNILKDYNSQDQRIKIINNESNKGPGANRNIGIKEANGKYLTFIDADDFYLNEFVFEELMNKVIDNDLELLIFNNREFDEINQDFIPNSLKRFPFNYGETVYNHILSQKELEQFYFSTIPFACVKIYLKDALIKNNLYFPEGIYYEDAAFSNYVSIFLKKVMVLKECFYAYRVNVSTSTTQNIIAKFDSIIKMHLEMLNFLKNTNLYEEFKIIFATKCVQSLCLYFLPQINDYNKAQELNSQILKFIEILELSTSDLKIIKKENPYVYYIIDLYKNHYSKDILDVQHIYINKMPVFTYIKSIDSLKILFLNSITLYCIQRQNPRKIVHYLFGLLPFLKNKDGALYLFCFIPVLNVRKYNFFSENYNYQLYKNTRYKILEEETDIEIR